MDDARSNRAVDSITRSLADRRNLLVDTGEARNSSDVAAIGRKLGAYLVVPMAAGGTRAINVRPHSGGFTSRDSIHEDKTAALPAEVGGVNQCYDNW